MDEFENTAAAGETPHEETGAAAQDEKIPEEPAGTEILPGGEEKAAAESEQTEAEKKAGEELSPAQKSVIGLISRYPGLSPENIPESVWRDFSQGRGSLAELYTRSENSRLRADNEAMRQRIAELEQAAENKARSTGSRKSEGFSGGSIIDSIWYSD